MDIDLVISQLKGDSNLLIKWYENNALKANPEKFHLILSKNDPDISIDIRSAEILHRVVNQRSEKLLGVIIDNTLNFDEHINVLKSESKTSCLVQSIVLYEY